jgi:hypothetical protein
VARECYIRFFIQQFRATGYALDERYGTDDFFNDKATRIPTLIVTMNDHFSEALLKNGCTVEFDSDSA